MKHEAPWALVDGTLVCVPAKCGLTSYQRLVLKRDTGNGEGHAGDRFYAHLERQGIGPYTTEQAKEMDYPKMLAVRDPVDRFRSLWQDKCQQNTPPPVIRHLKGMMPNQLMDHIEAHPDANGHWARQSGYWFEGVEVVRYDRLLDRLGYPQIHHNASQRTSVRMPIQRILAHYRDDARLYAKCI